ASVPENQPAWSALVDLPPRQTLVLAVIPLTQIRVDNGSVTKARQLARLASTLHRTTEDESERFLGEHRPHPLGEPAPIVGQRDIRGSRVLAAEAPRRLTVSDCEHVHVRLLGSDIVSLCRSNSR